MSNNKLKQHGSAVDTRTLSISTFTGTRNQKQIIFDGDIFDFTKPFVPAIQIESLEKSNEDEIILLSDQETIFYLQRKLQTNKPLDKEAFFESISNLIISSDVSIKPAIDDKEKNKHI